MKTNWWNPLRSVSAKLFVFVVVGIIASVTVIGTLSYQLSSNAIKEEVSAASLQTAAQAGSQIDFLLSTYESLSRQMLLDLTLKENLVTLSNESASFQLANKAKEEVTARLNNYKKSLPYILNVRLMTKDQSKEKLLNSDGGNSIGFTEFNQQFVQDVIEAQGNIMWAGTQVKGFYGYSSTPSFTMGRLLVDKNNLNAERVLLLEIDAKAFEDALGDMHVGEGGATYIVDADNRILYAADPASLEQALPIPLGEQNRFFHGLNGDEQLVVAAASESTGWKVVAHAPTERLLESASDIYRLTWIMTIIALLVAVLIGAVVVWQIGRPLNRFRNLMQRGKEGDLTVRMKARGKDEIGQLAVGFNEMMEQIAQVVRQTNASAEQVLRTAGEVSAVSKQTAGAAEEISRAIDEISKGSANLSEEARESEQLSEQVDLQLSNVVETNRRLNDSAFNVQEVSRQGMKHMSELTAKTKETEVKTVGMTEKVHNLKESASSIKRILELLETMAKQTNILSLNASIEASRAGSAGKGFMVIADEIRKLAEQSKQSIQTVGDMIERISNEVDETVEVMNETSPILQEQIASVRETDAIFSQVQAQMDAFIQGVGETSALMKGLESAQRRLMQAMNSVSSFSQQSSATAEQVTALSGRQLEVSASLVQLSDNLEQLSGDLSAAMKRFKLEA